MPHTNMRVGSLNECKHDNTCYQYAKKNYRKKSKRQSAAVSPNMSDGKYEKSEACKDMGDSQIVPIFMCC